MSSWCHRCPVPHLDDRPWIEILRKRGLQDLVALGSLSRTVGTEVAGIVVMVQGSLDVVLDLIGIREIVAHLVEKVASVVEDTVFYKLLEWDALQKAELKDLISVTGDGRHGIVVFLFQTMK